MAAETFVRDETIDLALLRTVLPGKGQAAFSTNVELGQDVAVFGFPLAGILSSGGTFATGTISALDAVNDQRYLQMSTPVQPGNSGGPLLDREGNVIGVVVARADLSKFQNVNFAIKAATAVTFLEANSIPYASTRRLLSKFWTGVAQTAKAFTVQIICSEQTSAPSPQPREQPPPLQPQVPPTTMTMRVRVVQDLTLRMVPDPQAEKVIVGPPLNDAIPKGATVELHYRDLNIDCRRYDVDAGHTIWCPVIYDGHAGWVNAFYLDTGAESRLSCSIDQTSRGCGQTEPAGAQSVPVMVPPWDKVLDPALPGNACGASGEIEVDSFVSVRAGPGVQYRELDRVYNGQHLVLCDNPHGGWYPVVYVLGGDAYGDKRCWKGDLTKWTTKHPYAGPCRSGWVSKTFVANIAG